MNYHNLKNQYRSNRNKEHIVKIIIYIVLIAAIVIFWFLSAKNVKSLENQFDTDSLRTYDEIKTNFLSKLDESDKSATELGIMAENMDEKGYSQYAIVILKKANEKDPSNRDLALYTAKVYFDLTDYDTAKEYALKACDLDPIYAPTYDLLTQIYTALGDEENANICYNKSKDFSEDNK